MTKNKLNEIETLQLISNSLDELEDKGAADRIVRWAWGKYVGEPEPSQSRRPSSRKKKAVKKARKSSKVKPKESLSIVKDLDLKPSNKTSLTDFINEKNPRSLKAKITVCAYYLKTELIVNPIMINHIYTCFKSLHWRLPADLRNMTQQAGSDGWLDSSDMDNLELTTIGENFVEHDLPKS